MDISGIVTAVQNVSEHLPFLLLGCRVLTALIAIVIVVRCGISLLRGRLQQEIWARLWLANDQKLNLIHWENTIGRKKNCDVVLQHETVSREHAVITRDQKKIWTIYPLQSSNPVLINGEEVRGSAELNRGDTISLGAIDMTFAPLTAEEERKQAEARTRPGREISPTMSVILVTLFQLLVVLQLFTAMDAENLPNLLISFGAVCACMWVLYIFYRIRRRTGYEVETLAFFLSSISLELTATKLPGDLVKQAGAVIVGVVLFFALSLSIRSLSFAKKLRYPLVVLASGLLAFNVLFGSRLFGAKNWVAIGPISFQPSELVKIVFVIAGAATLDRLFSKKNLIGTIVFSAYCVGCLALMSDFGTALIFFVAFLVIAFLRTGDLPSVAMVVAAAAFACVILVKFKPYIVNRFSVWRHAWEDPSGMGYQQVRTMSAIASGGLFGHGAGEGWLKKVAASTTDLVFGAVTDELGLLVALCCVAAIVIYALYAVKYARTARSCFYVICANAVAAMFLTQTMLNVFGSTDILPLTGVTLPFVSTGGSSMMCCWALLAYIKAADTRQNSGLAVSLPGRRKKNEEPEAPVRRPVGQMRDIPGDEETPARRQANQVRRTAETNYRTESRTEGRGELARNAWNDDSTRRFNDWDDDLPPGQEDFKMDQSFLDEFDDDDLEV